jgi:CubicO group peptidase (beta-lactamase class C family)
LLAAEMGLTPSTLSGAMEKTQAPQVRSGLLNKVGLGWQINVVDDYLWHNGGTGGYRSFIGFTKDRSLGVVVLANACNDVDDIGQFILGKRGSVADFSAPKKRIEVKIDASLYDQYAGQYKLGVGQGVAFSVTRRDNRLFVQLTGQEALEIFPESRTNFFYKAVDAQITFGTNETGAVTHLILHQNGRDQTAKRIGTDQAQPSD